MFVKAGAEANALLKALPEASKIRLLKRMTFVLLPKNTVLYQPLESPRYAHFMLSGVASISIVMQTGKETQIGLRSNDGLVESAELLGSHAVCSKSVVQIAGTALRLPLDELKQEFLADPLLQQPFLDYAQRTLIATEQIAACNMLHLSPRRLAMWLLLYADHLNETKLLLTQEMFGAVLGVRRSTIVMAAQQLEDRGLIRGLRGSVTILDREGLTGAACECYRVIRPLRSFVSGQAAVTPQEGYGKRKGPPPWRPSEPAKS